MVHALRLCQYCNLVLELQFKSVTYFDLEWSHSGHFLEISRKKMIVYTRQVMYKIQDRLVM